ncbi:MAG TPA: ABC transporter ATP-binding protein [Bryobacteraceae bacterium]|nr:ABC transporter ATP-binding protein [Bryobacteraceae bacterium]
MSTVLEVDRLSFSFDGYRQVLDEVTFSVEEGECLGVVGANGSGKSTLLWCLLGLHRAEGSVRMFGEARTRKSLRRVGVVFQNPEDQLFMPRLVDDVALPLLNRGTVREEARRQAISALQTAGLADAAERSASQLSLGERKRAAIAAALATRPELLMLDEPTAELDGRSVRRLASLLKGLPVTRLIASHDLRFLNGLCSRITVLLEGRAIADGPATEILNDAALLDRAGLV